MQPLADLPPEEKLVKSLSQPTLNKENQPKITQEDEKSTKILPQPESVKKKEKPKPEVNGNDNKKTPSASLSSRENFEELPNIKREGVSSEAVESHHREGISGESSGKYRKSIQLPKYEKDEASEELIKSAIKGNEFLKEGLDSKEKIQAVVNAMYLKNMPADSYVIKEGEPGSHLYVCAKGSFDVFKGMKKVNTLGPGKVFGELALLYNSKRNATIIGKC